MTRYAFQGQRPAAANCYSHFGEFVFHSDVACHVADAPRLTCAVEKGFREIQGHLCAFLWFGWARIILQERHHSRIMRTILMIEDDVYAKAKRIAEKSGCSLGEVISQLPQKGLAVQPYFETKNGVPVFCYSSER
jgi:hypothetical protein